MDSPAAPSPLLRWPRRALGWLRAVPIDDPVDRNHAAMLQLLLVFMGLYQPLLLLDALWRRSGVDLIAVVPALLNTAAMWICFVILRRGHLRFSAGLFVAVSLVLVGHGYLRWGLQAQMWTQLGQLLPILVGGLVLSRRALWIAAGSLALLMLLGAWRDAGTYLFDPFMVKVVRDRALHSVVLLLAITAVLDLAVASLRTSLRAVQQRNLELARARDRLQLEMREKDRARRQLLHAQKVEATGWLASGVAHDFNHLLALVLGYAQRGRQEQDVEQLHAMFEGVESAARRAAAVSRRLLDFSRLEEMHPKVFDAAGLVKELGPMLRHMFPEEVELRIELPSAPQPVFFDPDQLELMLLNLASNAAEAMAGGGVFTISLPGQDPQWVEISAGDTGRGMTAEEVARCREPFHTTKPAGQGTGLGLSVASDLAGRAGGELLIDSVPGAGTTVRVRLPRRMSVA